MNQKIIEYPDFKQDNLEVITQKRNTKLTCISI